MIVRVTTASRPQQRYDHRLRDLVRRTGDVTLATDLGVPRSTAELSPRTFCAFRRELSSLWWTLSRRRTPCNVLEGLSGVSARPMRI